MDPSFLESLLYQEESATLDIKREQYLFAKANHAQKAELLKDVLAFANAWREIDAHILIGVEEVRGGRSIVRGINSSDQLLDRNLQQFVCSKTNRPVSFSYAPFALDGGAEIGVLTIPLQERPVFLVSDFAHLKANVVYIRRGSATHEASPDEVISMRSTAPPLGQPALELDLADLRTRHKFGPTIQVEPRILELPERNAIPLCGPEPTTLFGTPIDIMESMRNRDYYRDVATYIQAEASQCSIGLAVTNSSTTVAENVVVTMQINADDNITLIDSGSIPLFPLQDRTPNVRFSRKEPRVDVATYGTTYEIKVQIGTVQPGTTGWSPEPFYVGSTKPYTVPITVTLSANNLRIPVLKTVHIYLDPQFSRLDLQDIIRRGDARR